MRGDAIESARRDEAARHVLALLLLACGMVCAAGSARADARFGDSTWVAPALPADGDSTAYGSRVGPPDRERGWETALRAPFRLAFLPLRLAAMGLEAGAGFVGPRYFEPKPARPPRRGPALAPYFSLGGLNDIGVGPAVAWTGPAATLRLAGTWSAIDRRRALLRATVGERRPVGFRLRADYESKPNRRYYGVSNDTPESGLSYFLLEDTGVEAALLLGASPLRQLRIAGGYSGTSPGRGAHGAPLLTERSPAEGPPIGLWSTRDLWYGVAADLGTLDDGRDPSRGIHGRVELQRASGLRSGDPDYDQWRLEGRAYLPVFAKRRVLALRAVYAGVEPRGGAAPTLPFYRLAQSEGDSRFAGYASGRFRDRQLLLARIEYRWAVLFRMSALALYELGEVAPRTGALRLAAAHSAWGGGLRLGLSEGAALRAEVARSVEGLHATLALGSDF